MNGWNEYRFADLVHFRNGKSTKEVESGDVPVFGSNGIIGGVARSMCDNAIILGRVGAYCGSVMICFDEFWATDNTIVVEPIDEMLDLRFCFYLLSHANLNRYAGGSAQPLLTQTNLRDLPFLIPPLTQQRKIATILGAYDDLIEVNRRRAKLLETTARNLFEEWFVRFRFPGHEAVSVVETSGGPLPAGWRWSNFGELAIEVRDGVSPNDLPPATRYIGLEHIPRRSTTLSEWGRAEDVESLKLLFKRGDVLFGKIRPYFHKVVWAPFDGVASSDAIIYRPRKPTLAAMSLAVASSDGFVATSVQTSNGTKMPRANPSVLKAYQIATDDGKWANWFGSATTPSIELAASLAAANHRLAGARDLLLPRLISGRLSVVAAEKELMAAA